MSSMLGLSQFKQLDSLESQIDRLNFRISQFVNTSICSESESEEPCSGHVKRHSSIDPISPLKVVQVPLDADSQTVFSQLCRVSMELEDLLSAQANCEAKTLGKDCGIPKQDSVQVVDLKDLYGLADQVQHAIGMVESGVSPYVSINFLGTCRNCQVVGAEFPEKSEIFNSFARSPDQADLKTCSFFTLPPNLLNTFCSTFEDSMKNQYFDHLFSGEYKQSRVIKEKKVFDNKSWALLQASYKKLKNYNENCESISNTLDWQRTELQILKSELNSKLQAVLKKEGELTFRQEELNKHQQEYQESLKSFEAKQQSLISDQVSLENYKKKLDKMKLAIKSQLEDLNKSNILSPRLADQTQGTLKRLKSNSTLNSDKADSEADFSQTEIQTSELSLTNPSKDFSFDRPLSGAKKLTLPSKLGFLSPQNIRTESFLKVPNKDFHLDKPPFPRTNKLPASSSTISNTELLTLREERLTEREAELEKREKEIQKAWLKNPNAQEFIPMIQSEMVRLKSLQREYDKKVKMMQDRINKSENFEESFNKKFLKQTCHSARDSDFKDFSSVNSDEESFIIHSRVEKLKDLYSMMEELV